MGITHGKSSVFNDDEYISVHNIQITISGKANDEKNESEDEKEGVKWLHQCISKNGFSVNFSLEQALLNNSEL